MGCWKEPFFFFFFLFCFVTFQEKKKEKKKKRVKSFLFLLALEVKKRKRKRNEKEKEMKKKRKKKKSVVYSNWLSFSPSFPFSFHSGYSGFRSPPHHSSMAKRPCGSSSPWLQFLQSGLVAVTMLMVTISTTTSESSS